MTANEKKGPVTELVEKYAALEQECAEHKDQYLRSLADFENYRRRVQRDFETVRHAAVESLLSELLPVLDNFDRALGGARNENSEAMSEREKRLAEGIQLIRRQMVEALGRHGVEEFSCLGEEFDPRRAEAVGHVDSADHEPDTVVKEHCKGYSCDGKVMRPAKVVIAKPAGRNQKSEVRDQKSELPEEGTQED